MKFIKTKINKKIIDKNINCCEKRYPKLNFTQNIEIDPFLSHKYHKICLNR